MCCGSEVRKSLMWYFTPITPLDTGIMFPNYTRCMMKFQGMFLVFTLKLGKWSNLTSIQHMFQMGGSTTTQKMLYVLLTTGISLAFWHKATQILDAQPTISLCNWSNLTHVPSIGAVWVSFKSVFPCSSLWCVCESSLQRKRNQIYVFICFPVFKQNDLENI